MSERKLWIPGPTEVAPEILKAMARPMIGHRGSEIRALISSIRPGLQRMLGAREVFFMTSSATTVMESGLRNLVRERALVASCGEFGKRWHEIGKAAGIATDLVEAPIGEPVVPEMVVQALRAGRHDALCLTWSETSTAVLNPIAAIIEAVKPLGDVAILVDAVTAVAALEIEFDALGADLLLAGTQKAMAMPPGLSVYALSERALGKAATIENRGYVTDFIRNKASMDKDETPATPSVSHLFALQAQLERIHAEGMPARAARHRRMSDMACAWGEASGHDVLARAGFRSPTVTCLRSPKVPTPELIKGVTKRCGAVLGAGYGGLKDTHFRIGHMGEHSSQALQVVLDALTETVAAGG
jgi:aspartate aminotransferase-like enzyme